MKWMPETRTLELSGRNVAALTDKLDDALSARSLATPCRELLVQAVEDGSRRDAAEQEAVVQLTRSELAALARVNVTAAVTVGSVTVVAVPDAAHYGDRSPGAVFMPGSGEAW